MGGDDGAFRVTFSSDGVSRLRGAIEEKLKEFMGDYTDDTLVEYVIVLLKNGRTKGEAKSELNVFLGDSDSDSFVSWLWDHLGSDLGLYMQQQELHTDEAPKTKPTEEKTAVKAEPHQVESEAGKGRIIKTHGNHRKQESKRLMRDVDENEVPLPRSVVADNTNSKNETRRRVGRAKPSLSPQPTIHKKRRRTEEQPRRKREVSQPAVSAPRRLLQFAVRDAVATSRPSNATAEPSLKRLRSVVSTSVEDSSMEDRPHRIPRSSMSAAIKAVAEAVKDASAVGPSRNVFNRLGHFTNASNTNNHPEYGDVIEDVGAEDFSVEMENFHSAYHPQSDRSSLQERDMSFHDTIMDTVLGYDGERYDDLDARRVDAAAINRSGTSGGNWVDNSLRYESVAIDNLNERQLRPHEVLGQPGAVYNPSLRIASNVSINTRSPQYQEEREDYEIDNRRVLQGGDTAAAMSEVRLMKENNNPIVAFNGHAIPNTMTQQSEKVQTPTYLHSTAPPAEDVDSRTIFVSNVHFAATKDSLSQHFNKFGEVLKVIILTDPASGQPKGSAYIEFMRKEAAELALSLDGTSFMSRILKIVKKSSAQPEAASVMTWPRIARASPFAVPRFGRVPFARGTPPLYRSRVAMKPGARSFQWKRETISTDNSVQPPNSIVRPPTIRSMTYVRTESKTDGSSGSGA